MMKNNIYIFVLFLSLSTLASYGQVGIGTTAISPDASAILDVTNPNKGVLIPRIALSDITDATTPINAPANSLIVYNTNAAVTGGTGIGFYYFNGTQWTSFTSSSSSWSLNGNSNTTPAANYVGTSDAQDFVIKTNNLEAMRITAAGDIGIGTNLPTSKLHISSTTSGAIILDDGFEDGTLAPFTTGGDVLWEIDTNPNTGLLAAQAPASANNNDITYMEYVATIPAAGGRLSFSYSTSTETGFDWLRFYIDGAAELEVNGIIGYTTVTFNLNPGTQTLRWEYSKDFSFSNNDDQVYIDDILITEVSDPIIRIADGTEAVNRILKSDAAGNGTWSDASNAFTDLDWIFNTAGTTNDDPLYHEGKILINQVNYLNAESDFYVNNGLNIGTQVGLGSIEYIIDDLSATLFSDNIYPLTNNTFSLGNATLRWNELFSTNGYTQVSDRRVKKDIKTIEYGIDELMNLNPVSYKWKDVKNRQLITNNSDVKKEEFVKPRNEDRIIGFIAQDLNKVVPEVVHTYQWEKDKENNPIKVPMKTLGVSYSDLIPVLIKSIQDQQEILETIESEQNEIAKKINLK